MKLVQENKPISNNKIVQPEFQRNNPSFRCSPNTNTSSLPVHFQDSRIEQWRDWAAESLSLCFTSVEAEIAGSADAPWRRWWQHHASVFPPSMCLSVSSDITARIHPSSVRTQTHTHTHPPPPEEPAQWSKGGAESRKGEGEMEGEVENESVGLSSCVQQQPRLQALKTPSDSGESRGEGRLLPAANHSPHC